MQGPMFLLNVFSVLILLYLPVWFFRVSGMVLRGWYAPLEVSLSLKVCTYLTETGKAVRHILGHGPPLKA